MASHNHHPFTAQPPSAGTMNFGLFDFVDQDFGFDTANSLPPQPAAKNVSPNGPRGDGLQPNDRQIMIGLLERIAEIMGAIKTAQDSRLAEDKSQDMALAKLNKNTGVLHKQLADVQERLASLGNKLDDLSARTEKHAKQVENNI
ncbi:hypothetical protein HBI68_256020 [Parastagonospora nodorum]|nr:hypothetical protein HBI84_250740 [Parastagonospora nodorum]KAH6131735.1 hypothetical protein HBI68_256020 [Parastagonospora nodorum]KAH6382689.1 hypothetical protein HBI60_260030 [Parastagonospora nodorum]KAH6512647.1 hypothetical protein HBI07_252920 [Parastagonospora nodorum]